MIRLNLQLFGGRGSSGGGGGGGSSNQANEQNYTITKEGKTYFARRADGYAVASGSDRQELENKLQTKMQREGAAFGMKSGETRNLTPQNMSREAFNRAVSTAQIGSTITTKDGTVLTKVQPSAWEGNLRSVFGGALFGNNRRQTTIISQDRISYSDFTSMKYIKK